jgi:hypothetical protein
MCEFNTILQNVSLCENQNSLSADLRDNIRNCFFRENYLGG